MNLQITPISEHIGAAITDIDLRSSVDAATVTLLRQGLAKHVVLVIRGQTFDPAQLLAAVRVLGEPMRQNYSQFNLPGFPNIGIINYDDVQTPADTWHTDTTNRETPPMATVLYALAVPSRGGDTSFANMRAAYAALPDAVKHEIDSLETVNTFDGQFSVTEQEQHDFGTPVHHPLVRTHPETGEKALYFHILKTASITGKTPAASRSFLEDLLRRAIQPDFVYRHKWQAGDLVIVDNRAAMHRVHDDYDRSEQRLLHRVVLEGDRPV